MDAESVEVDTDVEPEEADADVDAEPDEVDETEPSESDADPLEESPTDPGEADVSVDVPTAESLSAQLAAELRDGSVDDDDLSVLRSELEIEPSNLEQVKIDHLQSRVEEVAAYAGALEEFIGEHGTGAEIIESLRNEVAEFDEELHTMGNRLDRTESQVGDVESELETLTEWTTDLEGDVETLDERAESTESELESLGDGLDSVEADVRSVEDDLESGLEDLEGAIAELDATVDDVKRDVTDVETDVSSVSGEVDDLEGPSKRSKRTSTTSKPGWDPSKRTSTISGNARNRRRRPRRRSRGRDGDPGLARPARFDVLGELTDAVETQLVYPPPSEIPRWARRFRSPFLERPSLESVLNRLSSTRRGETRRRDLFDAPTREGPHEGNLTPDEEDVYQRLAEYSTVSDPTAPEYTLVRDDRAGKPDGSSSTASLSRSTVSTAFRTELTFNLSAARNRFARFALTSLHSGSTAPTSFSRRSLNFARSHSIGSPTSTPGSILPSLTFAS